MEKKQGKDKLTRGHKRRTPHTGIFKFTESGLIPCKNLQQTFLNSYNDLPLNIVVKVEMS